MYLHGPRRGHEGASVELNMTLLWVLGKLRYAGSGNRWYPHPGLIDMSKQICRF